VPDEQITDALIDALWHHHIGVSPLYEGGAEWACRCGQRGRVDIDDVEDAIAAAHDGGYRHAAETILAAVGPLLVEQGRVAARRHRIGDLGRQYDLGRAHATERIARALIDYAGHYPDDVFPADSDNRAAIGGTAMRHAYRNAAQIAREVGAAPTDPPAVWPTLDPVTEAGLDAWERDLADRPTGPDTPQEDR
jgi:hypothetical protein